MSEAIKSVVSEAKNYKKHGDIAVSPRTGGVSFKYLLGLALLLPYPAAGSYQLSLEWPSPQTTPYQFYGNGKQQAPFVATMCVPLGYKVQWEKLSFYDKKTREPYGTQFTPNTRVLITDKKNGFTHGIFNPPRVADTSASTEEEMQTSYGNCQKSDDTVTLNLYLMSDRYENDISVCASYKDESATPPLELDSCVSGGLPARTIEPFKYLKKDYAQASHEQTRSDRSSFLYITTKFTLLPAERQLPEIKIYPLIDKSFSTGGIFGDYDECFRHVATLDIATGQYQMVMFSSSELFSAMCDKGYTAEHEINFTDEYGNTGVSNVTFCFDQPTSC